MHMLNLTQYSKTQTIIKITETTNQFVALQEYFILYIFYVFIKILRKKFVCILFEIFTYTYLRFCISIN